MRDLDEEQPVPGVICEIELESVGVGTKRRPNGVGGLFIQVGDNDLCAFLNIAFRDRLRCRGPCL